MPKIGNENYPLYRVNALLKDVRTIYEKCLEREVTKEYIAEVLGQKADGGGFTQKIADLKMYGFLNGSRGKFTVSKQGVNATFGTPEEKAEALDEAVRNVGLWSAIYKRLGKDPNGETFWLDLVELTGAGRPESQSKAETVRKAYIEDAKYIISVEKPAKPPEPEKTEARAADEAVGRNETKMETTSQQNPCAPAIPAGNFLSLWIPEIGASIAIKDVKTYKAAKIFWEDIAAYWEEKIITKEEQPNVEPETQTSPSGD